MTEQSLHNNKIEKITIHAGETPGQWKCPCCRALVARADPKPKNSSTFIKSTTRDDQADEESVPGDFESLVLPANIHYYKVETTKWATLQAFLTAAACALAEQQQQQGQQQGHTCARSQDTSNFYNEKMLQNKPSLLINRCIALAERFCPLRDSITAFFGHAQLQRLLDPSLPRPFYRFIRYIAIVILSLGAIFLGVWVLRLLMIVFGAAVCACSDATSAFFNIVQMDSMCVPMVPKTWTLPIGFALVGLYITIQVAAIAGFTLRHVLLKWEEQAWNAVGAWFLVCFGYTVFVYFARYLLTVLVSCLVPFSNREFPGCIPSIERPCY
jgi:hypothetical protein